MAVTEKIYVEGGTTLQNIKDWLGSVTVPIDAHENSEVIYDAKKDADADRFNRMGAGLSEVAHRTRSGNFFVVWYEEAALAASQTDNRVPLSGTTFNDEVLWYPGHVLAIIVQLDAAVSAGTLTVAYFKGGTKQTDLTPAGMTGGTTQVTKRLANVTGYVNFGSDTKVGIGYTTDAGFLPTPKMRVGVVVHQVETDGA